jgi:molecular chaperone HtpG
MVASKVRVVSRAYGADEAYAWESDGVSGYTVEEAKEGERSALTTTAPT